MDQHVKDFSAAVIALFDVITMKATTTAQRADIATVRSKYSVYKAEVGAIDIIKALTPHLAAKDVAIRTQNATDIISAEARAALCAKEPEDVILRLYDLSVACYLSCSQAERLEVWKIVTKMYVACLSVMCKLSSL